MKNYKVYLVEDDLWYRSLLKQHIKKLQSIPAMKDKKLHLIEFDDGEDCINQLHRNPDLIVCDYYLNEKLNGLDTLKEIRKSLPDTKVIMLSGQNNVEIAAETMKINNTEYISKNQGGIQRLTSMIQLEMIKKDHIYDKRSNLMMAIILTIITAGTFLLYSNR